ncbi:undecaprenyl/decaprenyl-phosphate alpha-N-acetylglucosaminyl 1-phosphate transferase [bacterium]|nr:undecaprenyl/decaprenyl-phosphate alpha-N-acetylglucosaminyl 1-phosphate transferase [bacterium]RQV92204.1 MAG: undecaprenyl/decaprenyl-phosphate alpha-N-acetylglucosaminyl 1-phosphate transferase [bacterium]
MRTVYYAIVFFQTLAVTLFVTPCLIRLAKRWQIVDHPGDRKIHHAPKPLMGGVGIVIGLLLTVGGDIVILYVFSSSHWFQDHFSNVVDLFPLLRSVLPKLVLILAGGFLIHLLGLVDDILKGRLSYRFKFIVQFAVISSVVLGGVRISFMPTQLLDIVVTVVWIMGITNGFNLLDNMDGLASGISFICGGLLFVVAVLQGQVFFAFILAALTGSCLGFLFYNFHPSKLFMGDSGSLFLGYLFGTLTATGSYVVEESVSTIPVIMPILILSIPLYDTFSVVFIRWKEKRPLFIGDKKHFSHRLVDLGMTYRGAVVYIYLVCFCVGIIALLLPYVSVGANIIILIQAITIYVLITILIATGKQKKNHVEGKSIH